MIDEMAKTRENMSKSREDVLTAIRLQDEVIGEKNAALLAVKCRLHLSAVMEDFERISRYRKD